MIRRPPRSTLDRSSAASDVYKRQLLGAEIGSGRDGYLPSPEAFDHVRTVAQQKGFKAVSYTHLRAHETVLDLVCRLLLEKKKHAGCASGVNE